MTPPHRRFRPEQGRLPMSNATETAALDQIRTAYADAGPQRDKDAFVHGMRCLSFLVGRWLRADAAIEGGYIIDSYNRFDGKVIEDMIEAVTDVDPDALFAWGREGSPALYIETDKPNAVMSLLGPTSYEDADDPMFSEGRPDELGRVDPGAVGSGRKDLYGDGEDQLAVHSSCSHEAPPVPVEEYAEPDPDRDHIRAWWD